MRTHSMNFADMSTESLTSILDLLRLSHALLKNSKASKGAKEFYLLIAMQLMIEKADTALRIKRMNLRIIDGGRAHLKIVDGGRAGEPPSR